MQFKTIKEINDGLVSKKFSVEELIKDTFALINENKVLNCFISLNEENALARAKKMLETQTNSSENETGEQTNIFRTSNTKWKPLFKNDRNHDKT